MIEKHTIIINCLEDYNKLDAYLAYEIVHQRLIKIIDKSKTYSQNNLITLINNINNNYDETNIKKILL